MTQVPPTRYSSAIITRAPCPAAIRAARTPPDPAPMTKRSTWSSDMGVRSVADEFSDDPNAIRVRQNGGLCEPNKQSVLDYAGDAGKPVGQRARIGDPLQGGIEDPMTTIRDEREAVLGLTQQRRPRAIGSRGGRFDGPSGGRQSERHHLDRQGKSPEHGHPFRFI